MEAVAVRLLKEEMARHTRLRGCLGECWEVLGAKSSELSLPPGFKREHGIAIVLYTNSSNALYQELNEAVRGRAVAPGVLHEILFLQGPCISTLTRALQLLKGQWGAAAGNQG